MIESGNVYLPHPSIAPWIDDFIDECACFPNGRHDDQVDATDQTVFNAAKGHSKTDGSGLYLSYLDFDQNRTDDDQTAFNARLGKHL